MIILNIEGEIFKGSIVDFTKLSDYGFIKENNSYIYKKLLLDTEFEAIITIDDKKNLKGKVIDLQTGEEYLGLRTNMTGEFVNKVRELYKNILIDIKEHCFSTNCFMSNQANRIAKYIKEKYNNSPEFLWDKFDDCGVFRNSDNKKWYGIIMNIDISKIASGSGSVEILNVKLDEEKIKQLLLKKGFYKAYHMNKKSWISIILNDTLKDEEILVLIDESSNLVKNKE